MITALSNEQKYVTAVLAGLFFLIIGSFWLLGSLQEPIFYHLVGSQYHPRVNMISFLFILPLMFGYMALLDRLSTRRVFIAMLAAYAVFFTVAAALLAHPTIGLANTTPSVSRWLGWIVFAVIKTYGSFLVTLFWSFAVSVTTIEVAKLTFPFIVVMAQVGALMGTTLVRYASVVGIPFLILCAVAAMCVALVLLTTMHTKLPILRSKQPVSKTGLMEGVWLLLQRPYLRAVFVVSTAYLIIMAFADYQMHYLASLQYGTAESFAWFKGMYGQVITGCTLLLSLGGAQWLLRSLGVRLCLLIYPVLAAGCVVGVYLYPTLWPLFGAMIVLKAASVGLNNPTKEILYIPESPDVRFKAKSVIDMIGYRGMFAAGSEVTNFFKGSFELLVPAAALISSGVLVVWVASALYIGRKFRDSN